jgi:2-methylfumaryl-CoA hydratase
MKGPYADDLTLGTPLPAAPAITITEGLTAAYQAVTGDGLRLPLSSPLTVEVTGRTEPLVNPALALQVAIGQSTVATRLVVANLFYRDVALLRQVHVGDTLSTTVTPIALELTRPGPRQRRAKVALRIETMDQDGYAVCRFERVALLPCRVAASVTTFGSVGRADSDRSLADFRGYVPGTWSVRAFPATGLPPAQSWRDPLPDVVTSGLELVRLTQNLAAAHRDPAAGQDGRRLVYGGHTVGLAQASLSRACPGLITVLGWRSCDHVAPVFENDVLDFEVTTLDRLDLDHGALVGFRVNATARRDGQDDDSLTVLDWKPVALVRPSPEEELVPS